MDYCDWVETQRRKAPPVVDWEGLAPEPVADLNVSSHVGTVRRSWVGDRIVLARIVLRANSVGKPHRHAAEQVALVLRGALRLTMGGRQEIARAGAIVHIPSDEMHLVETLDEETEVLDVYALQHTAEELRKRYE